MVAENRIPDDPLEIHPWLVMSKTLGNPIMGLDVDAAAIAASSEPIDPLRWGPTHS